MADNEFPANSKVAKEKVTGVTPAAKTAPKKIKQVTTGEVVMRKKSWNKRVKEFIIGEDSRSVAQWVWYEVLVPSAKTMVFDAITNGASRRIWGDSAPRRNVGPGGVVGNLFGVGAGNVAYNRMGGGSTLRPDPRQGLVNQPGIGLRGRAQSQEIQEIYLQTRGEAVDVIDQMIAIADQYGAVSVADLFAILGKTGEWTDDSLGWTSLEGADVHYTQGLYLLVLPRPIRITNG